MHIHVSFTCVLAASRQSGCTHPCGLFLIPQSLVWKLEFWKYKNNHILPLCPSFLWSYPSKHYLLKICGQLTLVLDKWIFMVILHSYLNQFSVPLHPAALAVVAAGESMVALCRRKEGCLQVGFTDASPGSERQPSW